MSRTCSNKNEVFQNFNKMSDARAFTDYRSNNEIFRDIYTIEKFVKPLKIHMMHVFVYNMWWNFSFI